jgi:uncharacterized protein (DUF302 family)
MKQLTNIAIDHVVVRSNHSYDEVKAILEHRLGVFENTDEIVRQLALREAPWEEIVRVIEQRLGSSGFSIFARVEQGQVLSLAGKSGKAVQYAIGNPLLAVQMIEHAPEVGPVCSSPTGGVRGARWKNVCGF